GDRARSTKPVGSATPGVRQLEEIVASTGAAELILPASYSDPADRLKALGLLAEAWGLGDCPATSARAGGSGRRQLCHHARVVARPSAVEPVGVGGVGLHLEVARHDPVDARTLARHRPVVGEGADVIAVDPRRALP